VGNHKKASSTEQIKALRPKRRQTHLGRMASEKKTKTTDRPDIGAESGGKKKTQRRGRERKTLNRKPDKEKKDTKQSKNRAAYD